MKPYHFLVLRYQLSASLGELVNVGVLLISLKDRKANFEILTRSNRLSRLYPGFDGHFYKKSMSALRRNWKSKIDKINSDQEYLFDDRDALLKSLFSSLLPHGESTLVWSEVMSGIDADPLNLTEELFSEYVGKWEKASSFRSRVDDSELKERVRQRLAMNKNLFKLLQPKEISGDYRSYAFDFSWKNGKTQVLEPISFDYDRPEAIVEKAEKWTGRLSLLGENFQMISVLARPAVQSTALVDAYDKARSILSSHPRIRMAIQDNEMDKAEEAILLDTSST